MGSLSGSGRACCNIVHRTVEASLWPFPPLLGRFASLECEGDRLSSAFVRTLPMLDLLLLPTA